MRHTALAFIVLALVLFATRFITGQEWLSTASVFSSVCASALLYMNTRPKA